METCNSNSISVSSELNNVLIILQELLLFSPLKRKSAGSLKHGTRADETKVGGIKMGLMLCT